MFEVSYILAPALGGIIGYIKRYSGKIKHIKFDTIV